MIQAFQSYIVPQLGEGGSDRFLALLGKDDVLQTAFRDGVIVPTMPPCLD